MLVSVTYYPALASKTGVLAAILASYLHGLGGKWINPSEVNLPELLQFTNYEVSKARQVLLDAGLTEEKKIGLPCKLYIRGIPEAIQAIIYIPEQIQPTIIEDAVVIPEPVKPAFKPPSLLLFEQEQPKPKPKPVKSESLMHKLMDAWKLYYKSVIGREFIPLAKDWGGIKGISKMITSELVDAKKDIPDYKPTDEELLTEFEAYINKLPEWVKANQLNLNYLHGSYTTITARIISTGNGKSGTAGKTGKVTYADKSPADFNTRYKSQDL